MKQKGKIRHTFYISKRLFKVLCNLSRLYRDYDLEDPSRGSLTKALEDVIQYYSESKDYREKMNKIEENIKFIFDYMCKKDREVVEKLVKNLTKS